MPSPFLDGFRTPKNLPTYRAFNGSFIEELDSNIVDRLLHLENLEEEQKVALTKLKNQMKDGKNFVTHKSKLGRFSPDGNLSIIDLKRKYKHTIQKYCGWIDLDMSKSHLRIVYEVAKKNKNQLKHIGEYINNSKELIEKATKFYSNPDEPLDEKTIKELFTRGLTGGTFNGWLKDLPKDPLTEEMMDGLKEFYEDCNVARKLIIDNNNELYQKHLEVTNNDEYKAKNRTIYNWCCIIENEALHIAYKWLLKNEYIKERHVALEYDGLCFKPLKEITDETCYDINQEIYNKLGLKLIFMHKGYDKVLDNIIEEMKQTPIASQIVDGVEVIEATPIELKTMEDCETYEEYKIVFERNHFKVINKSMFMKVIYNENGTIKELRSFKEKDLITSYRHYTYEELISPNSDKTKRINFIHEWLNDVNIKIYDDIDCVPPPLSCPSNIFNTWIPFRMEQLREKINLNLPEDELKEIEDNAEILMDHIRILCNSEYDKETNTYQGNEVSDYIFKWLGQALYYPAIKTTAPCLISEEGAGKGTLIKIIKKLMGNEKVFETSEPDKYVWGNFNNLMLNAFFVSLNEMEQHLQEKAEGKIKELITDGDLTINDKGMKHIVIKSYHRFMYSSNNAVPVKSKKGDRRNVIIRCSDKLKGNSEYFTKINNIIEDDRVIAQLYDCLINIKNLDTFHTDPLPITEYQKEIQEANRDYTDLWLEDFTRSHLEDTEISYKSQELFEFFINWRDTNKFKYETNLIKFSRNLGLLKLPENAITKKKLPTHNETKFNIKKLIKHYKLE